MGIHDDVIKLKHFPRYWPFVRGIDRSPVNSPHKGQWRGALMFSLSWVNNREAGDLRRHRAHYDITVMYGLILTRLLCNLVHHESHLDVKPWKPEIHYRTQRLPTCINDTQPWIKVKYHQVSNIRRTSVGNWIVDHSDVVGASTVGAAPTTSSFST